MQTFEFNIVETATARVDIPDVGNVYIRATNSLHDEFYLAIITELGWSKIFQYGPVHPDIKILAKGYFNSFDEVEYKESTLCRTIDKFLNRTNIAKVELVEKEDFIKSHVNMIDKIS